MPNLVDLAEVKSILEIDPDDTEEDKKLLFLIEMASDWIEELLDRKGLMFYKSRTQYYSGTGTQSLLLNARPVFNPTTIIVKATETGWYGSNNAFTTATPLTYGSDFCLKLDSEDGLYSKSGILLRLGSYWLKPWVRTWGLLAPFAGDGLGNIQVTYSGGYTIDTLPSALRMAMSFIVGRLRYTLPIAMETTSDGYADRSIGISPSQKDYLLGMVKPMIMPFYKNWSFGGMAKQ